MILDRYVAVTFLRAFAGALLALAGLYVVVDGIERLDELIGAGLGLALRVYVYQMPMILYRISAANKSTYGRWAARLFRNARLWLNHA